MKAVNLETGEFITSLEPLTFGAEADGIDVSDDQLLAINETGLRVGRPKTPPHH